MTRRCLKPPIEELGPEAWQRIEAQVFERLDQLPVGTEDAPAGAPADRHRWVAFSLAAVALAAIAFAVVTATTSSPRVARSAPEALEAPSLETLEVPASERSAPDGSESPRSAGSRIATTTGPATTTLGESTLAIANHSELRIDGDDDVGWLVSLDGGSVHFDVAPRGRRPEFVVRAGNVVVTVVGTRFDVTREQEGARVAVQEGRVRVESNGHVDVLERGDSWPPKGEAQIGGELSNEKKPESSTRPRRSLKKAPTKEQSRSRRSGARSDRSRSRLAKAAERRARLEQRAREQFERATQLEHSDPGRATQIYRQLSDARGPWAANALYAEARLHLDRGERETSRRLLRAYLERYPSGANAADVRRLLSESAGTTDR